MKNLFILASRCFKTLLVIVSIFGVSLSSQAQCSGPITTFPYTNGLNNSLNSWTQDATDDFDWIFSANTTPSGGTGPSAPFEGSHYMFIEASGDHRPFKVFNLISPCIEVAAGSHLAMDFAYHMFSSANTNGSMHVDVSQDDGVSWTEEWSIDGDQGDLWHRVVVSFDAYAGTNIQIRIRGVSGPQDGGWRSDHGIDDIVIKEINTGLCYAIAEKSNGELFSWIGSDNSYIGSIGGINYEAMTLNHDGTVLFAINGNNFGSVNMNTAAFTSISTLGSGTGALGTKWMYDVDAMAINPTNGYIMAAQRRSPENDLLFVINPTTGHIEENYFGAGIDYREITGALVDIDDLAFHPTDGNLYAVSSVSGANIQDQIAIIDQYSGVATTVSVLSTCDIEGLTFDDNGVMYGSTGFEGTCDGEIHNTVYKIDYSVNPGITTSYTTMDSIDVEAVVCFVSAVPPCVMVEESGSISGNQTICNGDTPSSISSSAPASTTSGGTVEYQWYKSTTSCIAPLNGDVTDWAIIVGATGLTYNPGVINVSTCYVRGTKKQTCPDYFKFSNVVRIGFDVGCEQCVGNLSVNGDIEQEGTATNFNLSLANTPAMLIRPNKRPVGWSEAYNLGIADSTTFIGVYYLNKTGSEGDPHSGSHFTFVKGTDNCLTGLEIGGKLSCGKVYRLSAWVASYAPIGEQGDASFRFEFTAGGDGVPDIHDNHSFVAPASSSWNTLNWNQYSFDFTVTSESIEWSNFLFTSLSNDFGIVVDDICVSEVSSGSEALAGPDQYACTNGFQMDAVSPNAGYTGTWSVVNGTASIAAINSINSPVTIDAGNIATLRWTVSDGTCTSFDDIVIAYQAVAPVTVNSESVCNGEPTLLTASSCDGTVSWSNGETTNSITVSPAATTDYMVTCTSGSNVLKNADFESATDLEFWANWANSSITINPADVYSGNKAVMVDATSAWAGFGTDVNVIAGEIYEFSLWAKTDNPSYDASFTFTFYDGSWNELSSDIHYIRSGSYTYYNAVVEIPVNVEHMTIGFDNSSVNRIFVDDVFLTRDPQCSSSATATVTVNDCPVSCNILTNGEFNNGTVGWDVYTTSPATGAVSVDNSGVLSGNNSAYVDVSNSSTDWHVQLVQGPLDIEISKTYNISFTAKAESNKSISIGIQQNIAPYNTYYWSSVNLTNVAQNFSINNLSVSATASDALFKVLLGSTSDDVWIDNIVFEEVGCEPTICNSVIEPGEISGHEIECANSMDPDEILSVRDASFTGLTLSNSYPGFAIDIVGDNCNWIDYMLDDNLELIDNGDGTQSLSGHIINGVDADWDGAGCTASPCGATDSWYLDLTLSDMQDWITFSASGGQANVHANCAADVANLAYWNISGTLVGLGCNVGRTLTIAGPKAPYRLQIGNGGNSGDAGCQYGMSTWFNITEGATTLQADIYAFLNPVTAETIEYQWVKHEGDSPSGDGVVIPGATNTTYDPPVINTTTWYQRQAKSTICDDFDSKSNWIGKVLESGCNICTERQATNIADCQSRVISFQDNNFLTSSLGSVPNYWIQEGVSTFVEYDNGDAKFIMTVKNTGDDKLKLTLDISLTNPQGSQAHIFGSYCGPAVDSTDWVFYQGMTGTITGSDKLEGAVFTVSPTAAHKPQQGTSATLYSGDYGITSWMYLNVVTQPTNTDYSLVDGNTGDFFMNLSGAPDDCICSNNEITLGNLNVSNCIDQPLRDVATVSIDVTWQNAIAGDNIEVKIGGNKEIIKVTNGWSSPYTITFTVPADGTSNTIEAKWINANACSVSSPFNAPVSCSTDSLGCSILYLCGLDKPYDGDSWDHGWIQYLDDMNGANDVTPILTKDEPGAGTYDVMNQNNFVNVVLEDYDLIVISGTTEGHISSDLVISLKDVTTNILLGNLGIEDAMGMSSTAGAHKFTSSAYTDNVTQELLYDFDNPTSIGSDVITFGDYSADADAFLWSDTGDQTSGVKGMIYYYENSDPLPGVVAGHGDRTYIGYHFNGLWGNSENGGALPVPVAEWFTPEKDLTLRGKEILDQALIQAASNCTPCDVVADAGIDTEMCLGGTVSIVGTSTGGIAPVTFAWSDGTSGSVLSVSPPATTTYTVTATDASGCTDTDQVLVEVFADPSVTIVGGGDTICSGETAMLTSILSGGTGIITYQWVESVNGSDWNPIAGANTSNYTTPVLTATTYYRLRIEASGEGCGRKIFSPTATVVVKLESITLAATADVDSVCAGESVILTVNDNTATGGLIDYSQWTLGTGTIGDFNKNGSDVENQRIRATDPWGDTTVIWEARPEAGSGADGGWNTDYFPIDNTQTYRVSVWVNRKVLGANGKFYMGSRVHGASNELVDVVSGSPSTNPYFWIANPASLNEDEWMLVVGHIHANDYVGGKSPESGRYTINAGRIGAASRDYKWLPGSTEAMHRSYLYYSTDVSVRQQWVYPRFDIVDGSEPSIDDLLNGFDTNGGLGANATWDWYTGSCGGTLVGSGTTITVNPTETTTYYVRAAGDCNTTLCKEIEVVVRDEPLTSIVSDGNITCADATVTLTASPAGLTYAWSGGGSSQTKDVSSPGNYTVTVTDEHGCSSEASVSVTEETTLPTVDAGNDTAVCLGENTTISASASGGSSSGYTYSWNQGLGAGASHNVSPAVTTTYTVTVTDSNGCTSTDDVTITMYCDPQITSADICEGEDVVATFANMSGNNTDWIGIYNTGQAGANHLDWFYTNGTKASASSGGANGSVIFSGITDGNYELKLYANNNYIVLDSTDITVLDESPLTVTADLAMCEGSVVSLTASGADTYLWSNGSAGPTINVSPTITTLYSVIGTNNSGCTSSGQVTVTVSPDISTNIDFNGSECLTDDSGLSAVTIGGTAPYDYLWVGPDGFAGDTETIDVDTNGNYYVTVTDTYGCEAYTSGFVYQRYEALITNLQTEICEGDVVSLSISASNTASYQWSANAGGSIAPSVLVYPGPPSTTYTVTVTNSQGCTSAAVAEIDVNPKPTTSFVGSSTMCVGETANVLPAIGGSWTTTNPSVAIVNNAGQLTATGPGTANLVFQDNEGCSSDPLLLNVNVTPSVSTTNDVAICNGEEVTISAVGSGFGTLVYAWDEGLGNGQSKTFTAVGSDTERTFKDYVVTVTDDHGCTSTESVQVTIYSNPVPTITHQNVSCGSTDGSITFTFGNHLYRNTLKLSIDDGQNWLEVSDNLGSYTFANLSPNIYDLKTKWGEDECEYDLGALNIAGDPIPQGTATSDNGNCGTANQGSITLSFGDTAGRDFLEISIDGGTTFPYTVADNAGSYNIPNLTPGDYNVWMRWDDDACPTDIENVSILLATYPVAVTTPATAICEGDVTTIIASGGDTFLWDDSSTSAAKIVSPATTTTYSVTVTNSAGCTDATTVEIEVSPELSTSIDFMGSQCLSVGSQIRALHVGGVGPYTYAWAGPGGFSDTDEIIDVNQDGSYYVTILDSKGCSANTSAYVYQQFDAFIINLQSDICEGDSINLTASASAGTNYLWSSNANDAITPTVTVFPTAPSSTYQVTITNNVGCTAVAVANIDVEASPVISLTGAASICVGDMTNLSPTSGGVWISSNASVANVSYAGVVTGISAGTAYMSYIHATTGCESVSPIAIEVKAIPVPVFTGTSQVCVNETARLSPTIGVTWSSSDVTVATVANNGTVTAVGSGLAFFTFTDNTTGCTATTSQSLLVNDLPTTIVPSDIDLCLGNTTNAFPSTGGVWTSTNSTIASITNTGLITAHTAGKVAFSFTRLSSGCTSLLSDSITVLDAPTTSIIGSNEICINGNTTLSPSTGGTWISTNSNIATVSNNGVVVGISPGIVQFMFTNTASGCQSELSDAITVHADLVPYNTGDNPLCIGATTVYAPASGGTWTSSNDNIATIDNNGLVTAVGTGSVQFTYEDPNTACSASTTTPLTVLSPPDISLNGPSEICINESTTLSPSTGGTWTSSDNSIATISLQGLVIGVSAGQVTFTFSENSTGCQSSQSLSIDILATPIVNITGPTSLCIDANTSLVPTTGGVWISSDAGVATVTNAGVVTTHSSGIARFTFVSDQGCSSNQTSPIIVYPTPDAIISGPSSTCVGGTLDMLPSSGGTWVSSDPTIATITNTGLVTGVSQGNVTFTFTDTSTGCISDASNVVTIDAGSNVVITGSDLLCIGETTTLAPTVGGVWTSSDQTIAVIDNTGGVTALASGKVVFTFVNSTTGCQSPASDTVTVQLTPDINYTGATEICVDNTTMLSSTGTGTWVSNDLSIATVTNTGEVTALSQGIASFTFTDAITGCESLLSPPLTVSNNPTVNFTNSDEVCIGGTITVSPSTGGTWTSSNPSVATISNIGVVTGISAGQASFTYEGSSGNCISDGLLTATVLTPTVITISGDNDICIGATTTLSPTNGGIWTSSNPAIATVTNDGIVKGKAPGQVTFEFQDGTTGCAIGSVTDPITISSCVNSDFNVTTTDLTLASSINTNDNVPVGTSYSTSFSTLGKPLASLPTLVISSDGSYTFQSSTPGKYRYSVPVCIPPTGNGCAHSILEIIVLDNIFAINNPTANLESVTTYTGVDSNTAGDQVTLHTLANDKCVNTRSCSIDPSTVTIVDDANHGTTSIDANGNIQYTPSAGFVGIDTLTYEICVTGEPTNCSQATQIITVNDLTAENTVYAADNFIWTMKETNVSENLTNNAGDAESDGISISPVGSVGSTISVTGGAYYITSGGELTFIPNDGFVGSTEISYTVCDDNVEQACQDATVHILVFDDLTVKMRVYLESTLLDNSNATTPEGLPLMRDDLRSSPFTGLNYIPDFNPYKRPHYELLDYTTHYTHVGPGLSIENDSIVDPNVFNVTGRNAIVDWIFVELRSKNDMTDVIATRCGLLQRDGDVVDIDGVSDLRFKGINVDSFYVAIKHRTHLGVMTMLQSNGDVIDFTSTSIDLFNYGTTKVGRPDYTNLSANEMIKPGYRALWGGDFDCNGIVKFTNPDDDQNFLFFEVLLHPSNVGGNINYDFAYGYYNGDYNMNSKAKFINPEDDLNYLFFQILQYPHNGQYLSNYSFFEEQIPGN